MLDPDRWLEVLGSFLDGSAKIEHVVLGRYSVWPRERLVAVRDYIRSVDLNPDNTNGIEAIRRLEARPPLAGGGGNGVPPPAI